MDARVWARTTAGLAAAWLLAPTTAAAEPPNATAEPPVQTIAPAEGALTTIQDGATVELDYTLTVNGDVVDSSKGRSPLSYVQGRGQLIPGLERQLVGLKAGDTRSFTIQPEDGYGLVDPKAVVEVARTQLPNGVTPEVGMPLRSTGPDGRPFRATVSKVGPESVTLDLNHPLAGKTLLFDITIVKVGPGASS